MYANVITGSMQEAIAEMNRRREVQIQYNKDHGITPESVRKAIGDTLSNVEEADYYTIPIQEDPEFANLRSLQEIQSMIDQIEQEMNAAATNMEFEKAAGLRDKLKRLKEREIAILQ
jgi:excinuclease ABC subunit B